MSAREAGPSDARRAAALGQRPEAIDPESAISWRPGKAISPSRRNRLTVRLTVSIVSPR